MHPTILTIGLITAFTTPKIRATPIRVRILDPSEAACSSIPGTTAVATARAAAETSTRSRKRMPHLGITDSVRAPAHVAVVSLDSLENTGGTVQAGVFDATGCLA